MISLWLSLLSCYWWDGSEGHSNFNNAPPSYQATLLVRRVQAHVRHFPHLRCKFIILTILLYYLYYYTKYYSADAKMLMKGLVLYHYNSD